MFVAINILSRGTFIKAHYHTLLKRTIIHSLFTIGCSNNDVPSSTCFVAHASCSEELERFVHRILSFTIPVFYRLPSVHATIQRQHTINYQLVSGLLRLTLTSIIHAIVILHISTVCTNPYCMYHQVIYREI